MAELGVGPRSETTLLEVGGVPRTRPVLPTTGDPSQKGADVAVDGIAPNRERHLAWLKGLFDAGEEICEQKHPHCEGAPHCSKADLGWVVVEGKSCLRVPCRREHHVDGQLVAWGLDKVALGSGEGEVMYAIAELSYEIRPHCGLDNAVFTLQALGEAVEQGALGVGSHLFIQTEVCEFVLDAQIDLYVAGKQLSCRQSRCVRCREGICRWG